jgi:hypothetical protein
MGLGRMTSTYSLTRTYTKPTNKWLVHCCSTFGVRTNHMQIQIHKIHHSSDLGEATTFPLIIYSAPFHEAHIQMTFCPESPEIPKVGTPTTLGPHKFVCKPLVEMKSKANL